MQRAHELLEHVGKIRGVGRKVITAGDDRRAVRTCQCVEYAFERPLIDGAEHPRNIIREQLAPAMRHGLIGQAERVTHAAVGRTRKCAQGLVLELHGFRTKDMLQVTEDPLRRHVLQVKLQAP